MFFTASPKYTRKIVRTCTSCRYGRVSSAIAKPSRGTGGYQEDKDTKNGSLLLHVALFMRVRGRRTWHQLSTDAARTLSCRWISRSRPVAPSPNFLGRNLGCYALHRFLNIALASHGLV